MKNKYNIPYYGDKCYELNGISFEVNSINFEILTSINEHNYFRLIKHNYFRLINNEYYGIYLQKSLFSK